MGFDDMTRQINGLTDVFNQFDLFLIDQFGVLHDGVSLYPSVTDTLAELRTHGKSVVVISNSGKRSSINISRLAKIGIDDSLYDHLVTSGEVAHHYLTDQMDEGTEQTCYLISRDQDISAVADLNVTLVNHPNDASLIIISSSEGDRLDEAHYRELLAESAANNTLCLCTNPDKKMLTPDGLKFAAGRIAEIYEEEGGYVHWIGKPYQSIYTHVLSLFQQTSKAKVLCIGDSIEHDIAGGKMSGLNTLLVRTGIAADLSDAQLSDHCNHYGVTPDYVAPGLRM